MQIFTEEQILDQGFRARVIKDINGTWNKRRKREMRKRHEVLKDNTVKYVIEKLIQEGMLPQTIALMENRAANISVCRKIIEKLARCYNGGAQRDAGGEVPNQQISDLAVLMEMDQKMKKADKYSELFKNCAVMVIPEVCEKDESGKDTYRLKTRVLGPWQYDVIENAKD